MSDTDTEPDLFVTLVEDLAECLHHLSARVAWSPGPAREDFEIRVDRIRHLAELINAEDDDGPVGATAEGVGTIASDSSGMPPSV